jgi:hypothetical protein
MDLYRYKPPISKYPVLSDQFPISIFLDCYPVELWIFQFSYPPLATKRQEPLPVLWPPNLSWRRRYESEKNKWGDWISNNRCALAPNYSSPAHQIPFTSRYHCHWINSSTTRYLTLSLPLPKSYWMSHQFLSHRANNLSQVRLGIEPTNPRGAYPQQ